MKSRRVLALCSYAGQTPFSRYIHTSDAETYRPISEIVKELEAIEAEAKETDKALKDILSSIME